MGQFTHGVTALFRPSGQRCDLVVVGVGHILLHIGATFAAGTGGSRFPSLVLAGEETTSQRKVGQDANVVGVTVGDHLLFLRPLEHVVVVLDADKGRPTPEVGDGVGPRQLPGGKVGGANVAHLATAHQIIERAQRLFNWRGRVPAMDLVEVDVVTLQAAQAGFDAVHNVIA